jgi:hypothetical protein
LDRRIKRPASEGRRMKDEEGNRKPESGKGKVACSFFTARLNTEN